MFTPLTAASGKPLTPTTMTAAAKTRREKENAKMYAKMHADWLVRTNLAISQIQAIRPDYSSEKLMAHAKEVGTNDLFALRDHLQAVAAADASFLA